MAMGNPTNYDHFLLKNFTGEGYCHVCGAKFEDEYQIWNVEGILIYNKLDPEKKGTITWTTHLDCLKRNVILN